MMGGRERVAALMNSQMGTVASAAQASAPAAAHKISIYNNLLVQTTTYGCTEAQCACTTPARAATRAPGAGTVLT
jgi:hypothetical protein